MPQKVALALAVLCAITLGTCFVNFISHSNGSSAEQQVPLFTPKNDSHFQEEAPVVAQKSESLVEQQNAQTAKIFFECPSTSEMTYVQSYDFTDADLSSALFELSQCNGINNITSLQFFLMDAQLTTVGMFSQLFEKTKNLMSLLLSLPGNKITDAGTADFKTILAALPQLQKLLIDFSDNNITHAVGFYNAFQQSTQLRELSLQFAGPELENLDALRGCLSNLLVIEDFTLNAKRTSLEEFPNLASKSTQLTKLKRLYITFDDSTAFSGLENLGHLLNSAARSLSLLSLNFKNCNVRDTYPLWQGTHNIVFLKYLYLDFQRNAIEQLIGLETAFQKLSNIQELYFWLNFNQLNDTTSLWKFLNSLPGLNRLELQLSSNNITSVAGAQTAWKNCQQLHYLILNIAQNQLSDAAPLGKSLQNLENLSSFHLDLSENQIDDSILDLAKHIHDTLGATYMVFYPLYLKFDQNLFKENQYVLQGLDHIKDKLNALYEQANQWKRSFYFYY